MENPTPFYQIYARLLPKEITGELEHRGEVGHTHRSKLDFSKLTPEELRLIARIPIVSANE